MGLNQSSPCGERAPPPAEVYEFKPRTADVRKLLLKTLPVFMRAGTQQASLILAQHGSTLFENPVHEYLVHLGTASCAFVEYLQPENLSDKEVECFASQLLQLASLLNSLLDENFFSSWPEEELPGQPWVQLHRLSESASTLTSSQAGPDEIRKMFASPSPEQCSKVYDLVIELDNDFQKGLEQVSLDLKSQPLEPFAEIFTFSEVIYSMLNCSVTKCTVNACHGAMLKLGKYKRGLDDYDSWHLCVLLAPLSSRQHWCETAMYRAKVRSSTPKVSFAQPEESKSEALEHGSSTLGQWRCKVPQKFHCLCNLFEVDAYSKGSWRLNLIPSLEATCIENHKSTPRLHQSRSLVHPITLNALLRTPNKRWTGTGQFTLGLTLAYSLFYLYGGQWAQDRWSRKNIVFYEHDHKIYPKPFLFFNPDKPHGLARADDGIHRFPEIMELGIILLEIHIDQDLSSYLGHDPVTEVERSDDMLMRAYEVFEAEQQRMASPLYRDAVRWCLEAYHDLDVDEEDMAFQALRTALFERVISPLECEIRRTFSRWVSVDRLDEDEEVEKINLAPKTASKGSSLRRPHDMTADDEHASKRQRAVYSLSTLLNRPKTKPSLPIDHGSGVEISEGTGVFRSTGTPTTDQGGHDTRLIGTEGKAHGAYCPMASTPSGTFGVRPNAQCPNNWLSSLDQLTATMKMRKTMRSADHAYHPVKIAVLDTGLKSNWCFGNVTYRDFVDPKREGRVDNTSHGTASVDLILHAYPEAELYVGRVFNTNQTDERTEPALLAEAIDWAAQEGVDIINISAGFRNDHVQLRKAIKQAHEKEILIFAAAANWGNAGPGVAFPAAIKDHVFCISSCTDDLWASNLKMNPPGRNDADNFASLGEDVSFYEDKAPLNGTSVAAPLAAGLAARILDFARHIDSRSAGCDEQQLRTRPGMRAVFKKISKQDGLFRCIAPWLLWQHPSAPSDTQLGRERIQEVIKEALNTMDR